MPHLDPLLSFPSSPSSSSGTPSRSPTPPVSAHVLVTDTLDAPASFVLVHFLRAALKAAARVVWLGSDATGLAHWKHAVRRSGINLDTEAARGTFAFIDVQAQGEISLRHLYDAVAKQIQGTGSGSGPPGWQAETVVIVDDLCALAWGMDSGPSQVSQWIRALRALVTKNNSCLVTLQHADATSVGKSGSSDQLDDTLYRSLLRTADVWVEVKELSSGRARDCDGEIIVHPLVRPSLALSSTTDGQSESGSEPSTPLAAFAIETPCPSRDKAMLYRIASDAQTASATGIGASTGRVQVWARGTGRGFL